MTRTGRRQFGDKQVGDHRPGIHHRADPQRRQHVPVCQHPTRHRAQQDRRYGRGLHQPVGFDQLIARRQFTEDTVLGGGVGCRPDPHQRIANKRIHAKADAGGTQQLQAVGEHHHPPFGEAVRHLTDKGGEKDVSAHKHHLQDRLAPVRVKLGFEQRQGGKQQRVITKGREELGGSNRHHPLRPDGSVSGY
ncbi:hypothetical protein D3C76_1206440 [compost metagenome]